MCRTCLLGSILLTALCVSNVRAGNDPLEALGQRYLEQQKLYDQARASAKTDAEALAALADTHPINVFVDDFLAIEESYRGQAAAISALYQLTANAGGIGDPDLAASRGRVKAIQRLREHYREHPDIDLLFDNFEAGCFVPEAEGLLRDATQSPHRHVRAAARYLLARFLCLKADMDEWFGADSTTSDPTAGTSPILIDRQRKLREQMKKLAIDPAAERANALQVIEELVAQEPDVLQTSIRFDGTAHLNLHRGNWDDVPQKPKTYSKMAEALRFELKHLQAGQMAPDITGKDADGLDFNLSDYRGRVVLLFFSANWCGPCKAMYPDLRKLQADLEQEPFAILAVMGDQEHQTVIDDTASGEIRWRTWFDGNDGPIATTWNIDGWPTATLLDHNGVIANREVVGRTFESFKKAIDPLIAAQKADPKSQELIEAHPLPELPFLKQEN